MEENIKKKPACIFRFFVDAEQLEFIHQVIYYNFNAVNSSYTLKACFLEGLELMKIKWPNVPERVSTKRRRYMGGTQHRKKVTKTGLTSTPEINNWIENLIAYRMDENIYYSKVSFIEELLEELKIKYQDKLLTSLKRKAETNLDENQSFDLSTPLNEFVYVKNLIAYLIKKDSNNYTVKSVFLEGLELLKAENPLINDKVLSNRRYYTGGKQKNKIKTFSSSVIIPKRDVNWVNNYILQNKEENMFFSKADFMTNLVQLLKKKYGENLQD